MNNDKREQIIAERKALIKDLDKLKRDLVKQAAKLLRKPARRPKTMGNRLEKAIALIMRAQAIEIQQYGLSTQPLPRPKPSFKNGSTEVGETGPEIVQDGGRSFAVPNYSELVPANFPNLTEFIKSLRVPGIEADEKK